MTRPRLAATALALLAAGVCSIGAGGAGYAPGQLDPTWGDGGRLFVPIAGGRSASVGFQGLARLPSGTILAGLFNYTDCANTYLLFRADRRGKPDETLGKRGLRALKGGSTGQLVLLPGGKLLAGALRITADGSIDKTFRPARDLGRQIRAQPNGKIVSLDGQLDGNYEPTGRWKAVRVNANGSLDRSFGQGGKTVFDVGDAPFKSTGPIGIVHQPDGKLVGAGTARMGSRLVFALVRLTTSGKLDPSFGTAGVVLTPVGRFDAQATDVAVARNGNIVVSGYAKTAPKAAVVALARFRADGRLDSTLGSNGTLLTTLRTGFVYGGSSVALSGNDLVIVSRGNHPQLARLRHDGSLDARFGAGGTVDLGFQLTPYVDPSKRVVLAGIGQQQGKRGLLILRYRG